jgi:hypothetical protein
MMPSTPPQRILLRPQGNAGGPCPPLARNKATASSPNPIHYPKLVSSPRFSNKKTKQRSSKLGVPDGPARDFSLLRAFNDVQSPAGPPPPSAALPPARIGAAAEAARETAAAVAAAAAGAAREAAAAAAAAPPAAEAEAVAAVARIQASARVWLARREACRRHRHRK